MEFATLSGTTLQVSRVGLGTWAIGGWMWGGSDEAESIQTIHQALDSGINVIDTAENDVVGSLPAASGPLGVAIEDRPDVLGGDRDDSPVGTIEQDVGAHHSTSVTESLPPADSWMTAILCPGVQVKYSGQSTGR